MKKEQSFSSVIVPEEEQEAETFVLQQPVEMMSILSSPPHSPTPPPQLTRIVSINSGISSTRSSSTSSITSTTSSFALDQHHYHHHRSITTLDDTSSSKGTSLYKNAERSFPETEHRDAMTTTNPSKSCNRIINGSSSPSSSSSMEFTWMNGASTTSMYHPPHSLPRSSLLFSLQGDVGSWKVIKGISSETISDRIFNFLRINSIQYSSSYHQNRQKNQFEAAPRIECSTESTLKFSIQLWEGKITDEEHSNNNGKTIILQVSRRRGCTIEMHNIRQRLYHAVLTGEQKKPQQQKSRLLIDRTNYQDGNDDESITSSGFTGCNSTDSNTKKTSKCKSFHYPKAFHICIDLLQSTYIDQNRLGLETLCILTDPKKVSTKVAESVSQTLVIASSSTSNDDDGLSNAAITKLQEAFLPYFTRLEAPTRNTRKATNTACSCYNSAMTTTATTTTFQDSKSNHKYQQGEEFEGMHLLALRALSNALELVGKSSRIDVSSKSWKTIVSSLVYNIHVAASHRPLEAAFSAKCLHRLLILVQQQEQDKEEGQQQQQQKGGFVLLTESFESTRGHDCNNKNNNGLTVLVSSMIPLLNVLEIVHQYGKSYNLKLEHETENLMRQLRLLFAC